MKTEEIVKIAVSRFRDKSGQPTCAEDHPGGRVCKFYLTIGLAQSEKCTACLDDRRCFVQLHRRGANRDGTLIPNYQCPLWQEIANE